MSTEGKQELTDVQRKLGQRLFDIFNVEEFFKELEQEGRERPDPEALSRLLDTFRTWVRGRGQAGSG